MLPSILLLLLSLSVSGSLVIILTWAICRLLKKSSATDGSIIFGWQPLFAYCFLLPRKKT